MQSYAARLAIHAAHPMPIPSGLNQYPFLLPVQQTLRADFSHTAFSRAFRPSDSTSQHVQSERHKGQAYRRDARPGQEPPVTPPAFRAAAQIMRKNLIRYVDTWYEVKPNFKSWVEKNPKLSELLLRAAHQTRYEVIPTVAAGAILSRVSPSLRTRGIRAKAAHDAAWLFIDLVTGSVPYDVGKCERCAGYYLNFSGHRNKVFCSRRCATASSAEKATRERRMKEKRVKLTRAAELCKVWKSAAAKQADWKQWVAKRSGLTPKWLTRAVNRGELRPPITTQAGSAAPKRSSNDGPKRGQVARRSLQRDF
jgi:hypothetical protein